MRITLYLAITLLGVTSLYVIRHARATTISVAKTPKAKSKPKEAYLPECDKSDSGWFYFGPGGKVGYSPQSCLDAIVDAANDTPPRPFTLYTI
jgi:hypothetical protein